MNVLVTGGTGFVGHVVIQRLAAADHSVRALARNPRSTPAARLQELCRKAQPQGAPGVLQIVPGDVIAGAGLPQAAHGVDAIIHLVGIISEIGSSTFENAHTRATLNMVAAAQASGVRRYLQMSALGTRPRARSRYHQTKWAAEEAVRPSGLDWTILRPSLIYGPHDHFVNLYARLIRISPVVPLMGRAATLFQPVHVDLVADALVRALAEPRAIGQTFELGGPEKLTLRQIVQGILNVMNRKRLLLQVPAPLATFQAILLETIFPALFRQAPPLNRDQLLMLEEDNTTQETAATSLFRLDQRRFAEAIRDYLE